MARTAFDLVSASKQNQELEFPTFFASNPCYCPPSLGQAAFDVSAVSEPIGRFELPPELRFRIPQKGSNTLVFSMLARKPTRFYSSSRHYFAREKLSQRLKYSNKHGPSPSIPCTT
ncbi:hypothetical protein AcW1_001686 [Taiwanofungus camphoratus]|nr:hypothetical protein AcV5_000271 [Antrodia cinnamomea]KAI0944857.1 hypothetical protein AcV7_001544 [Antrodia cinnamomea]KAI0945471.1 hypothetical protein AcW1_001686 [Antrodia cinnamomea]